MVYHAKHANIRLKQLIYNKLDSTKHMMTKPGNQREKKMLKRLIVLVREVRG